MTDTENIPQNEEEQTVHLEAHVVETPEDAVAANKAKGVTQMVAGAALAAVGVPMLVLPGPGAAAIAGGVLLAGTGFKNVTGHEPISEETRQDPNWQAGEQAGQEWAARVRAFAAEDLAPAGKQAAHAIANGVGVAASSLKGAASAGADLAGKGFRAVAGDKAADSIDRAVTPIAKTAGAIGKTTIEATKPVVHAAAEAGKHAARKAAASLAEKAKNFTQD